MRLDNFDVVYISYDEPRCEENWAELLCKVPWAKRVHKVKGFDAAHKAAANAADTENFVTVDGDNKLLDSFINSDLPIDDKKLSRHVYSFAAINYINGLVYGNNGVKIWPKDVVLNMNSHETAKEDGSFALDFCWDIPYIQKNEVSSVGYANGSPFQSFRAGFREGVKMGLGHNGWKVSDPTKIAESVYPINLKRLLVWCSLGSDVDNGIWAVYGARLGFIMTNFRDFNIVNINNYDWFQQFWNEEVSPKYAGEEFYCPFTKYRWNSEPLWKDMVELGVEMKKKAGLNVADLTFSQSAFVKDILKRDKGEL